MSRAGVDERILHFLRETEGFLSGEELSARLGVSRTAIWKHIKGLRLKGYRINAVPAKGYSLLSPADLLAPMDIGSGLATRRVGREIICLKEIDSTNTHAFRLAEEGAAEGTVVLADTQTAGKGRLGRTWLSPPGVNLYCSVILRPPIAPLAACQLTFLSVVAVARAVEKCTTLVSEIKWPNDLLVSGKKVCGLLNEMNAETEQVNFVVLGIGVNLNMTAEQLGNGLRHPATSLMEEGGVAVDRVAFTRVLLEELDSLYDLFLTQGERPVREEWLARSDLRDRGVTVVMGDRVLQGVARGVDQFGALLVERPDGAVETVLSGDVTLQKRA
ncbi:biotin--[acetyl-CoA-carboxylase] ligase [Geomonas sp. RF6]|uniref:biotin--[acetyl-CoA-carboxylase] ligase n=1 Tax=Geomonas sp. RF6 TaxID=2897342 RepID=UPI001E5DD35D|nr:biotin--[acetyl-CoA-carboxylase] ligase [Geomonas sp. RF6]UFS69829.1 biotin--[acetyl-CoA-carboxylase] ligase [Geomonas sp. RF6]